VLKLKREKEGSPEEPPLKRWIPVAPAEVFTLQHFFLDCLLWKNWILRKLYWNAYRQNEGARQQSQFDVDMLHSWGDVKWVCCPALFASLLLRFPLKLLPELLKPSRREDRNHRRKPVGLVRCV